MIVPRQSVLKIALNAKKLEFAVPVCTAISYSTLLSTRWCAFLVQVTSQLMSRLSTIVRHVWKCLKYGSRRGNVTLNMNLLMDLLD